MDPFLPDVLDSLVAPLKPCEFVGKECQELIKPRIATAQVLLGAFLRVRKVPGPRFELGTRRFSVACSTN